VDGLYSDDDLRSRAAQPVGWKERWGYRSVNDRKEEEPKREGEGEKGKEIVSSTSCFESGVTPL